MAISKKEIFFLILFFIVMLVVENYFFENGWARYFFIVTAMLAILFTITDTFKHYNKFCRAPLEKRSNIIAKQKFLAEILAATALLAFILILFQSGIDIDRNNTQARFNNYESARQIINEELTNNYCSSKPYRQISCSGIGENLNMIMWNLTSPNEVALKKQIDSVKYTINEVVLDISIEHQAPLKKALNALNQIIVGDAPSESFLKLILQLILLLTSVMAVSRKVAIAAFDASSTKETINFMCSGK